MAEDERQDRSQGERSQGERSGDERREPETRRDVDRWIEESDDTQDFTDRVAEEIESRRAEQEGPGEEGSGRGRVFTKDQLVEEAAVAARGMYGTVKHSLEMDTYGQQIETAGYYDLVDCWMVIGHLLDLKYHEDFLKRASYLRWGSRINRRLIPNYYLFSLEGVNKAIDDHYISPLFEHKLEYLVAVRWFLPIGPPLAYLTGAFGPTHEEAAELARLVEGGGHPTAEHEQFRSSINYLRNRIDTLADKVERQKQKMERYEAQYEQTGDKRWDRMAEQEAQTMEETMEELEELYAKYEKKKKEAS